MPPRSQNQEMSAQSQILQIILKSIPQLEPGDVALSTTVRGNLGQGSGEIQKAVSFLGYSPSKLTRNKH